MEKYDLIIKNGAVVLADKVVDNCAIAVKDGKIAAMSVEGFDSQDAK